jgi:hypothetical protein
MDSGQFVRALKIAVEKSSVKGIKELLMKPPGRKPHAELLRRSEWFNNLSEEDKNMVMEIAGESVKSSVFGFLCVLDGVRAIEDEEDKGDLKLYFEKGGNRVLINDPDQEFLHDLYKSEE